MRETFSAYYLPDEERFKLLWTEARIVLDANVLLNLYRYPISASNDLLALLQSLSDRIVIPYQAALEYQIGRLGVIASQRGRFDEVRKVLTDIEGQLHADLGKLQLQKRHSSISPDQLFKDLRLSIDKFRSELEIQESKQPDVFDDDPIRSALDEILKGKIGQIPTQAQIDEICAEGKKRYEDHVPPGYKDETKGKDKDPVYTSNGLRIERKFGDLLVWKQIIDIASSQQINSLIFVTDDEKPDWWWAVDSKGNKTIGPRPELIEEIRRGSGVKDFYIYSSERFMQYASKYLGIKVRQESIDQIGDIREFLNEVGPHRFGILVEDAIYRWLCEINPPTNVARNHGFPDFTVRMPDGNILGYEVKIATRRSLERIATEGLGQWEVAKKSQGLDNLCLVLVARSESAAVSISEALVDLTKRLTDDLVVLLGHMLFVPDATKPTFVLKRVFNGRKEIVGLF